QRSAPRTYLASSASPRLKPGAVCLPLIVSDEHNPVGGGACFRFNLLVGSVPAQLGGLAMVANDAMPLVSGQFAHRFNWLWFVSLSDLSASPESADFIAIFSKTVTEITWSNV